MVEPRVTGSTVVRPFAWVLLPPPAAALRLDRSPGRRLRLDHAGRWRLSPSLPGAALLDAAVGRVRAGCRPAAVVAR